MRIQAWIRGSGSTTDPVRSADPDPDPDPDPRLRSPKLRKPIRKIEKGRKLHFPWVSDMHFAARQREKTSRKNVKEILIFLISRLFMGI